MFFPVHSQRTAAVKLTHHVAPHNEDEDICMAAAGFMFLAAEISKESTINKRFFFFSGAKLNETENINLHVSSRAPLLLC
jgi:hypothetical protein